MPEIIYSWEFSSKKQRGTTWYIITLSIVIGLVIWGFLTKQYGMSFIILLITGITYFVENNSQDIIKVKIVELGIKVEDNFYDFSRIESYSIIYSNSNATILRLKINKKGVRIIDLKVSNEIALNLEQILPNYIKENSKQELTFSDKIIELLKL